VGILRSATGASCLFRTDVSGYATFVADLQLPQGAEINELTVSYIDNSIVGSLQVDIMAYDGAGSSSSVATASSAGWSGYGSASADPFSYIVDNEVEALVLKAAIPDNLGSGVQI
jgi:hypothetical protein